MTPIDSSEQMENILSGGSYICDPDLAMVVYLGLKLGKPLFLEGEAGVGKTELAKVLAERLERRLIRLQCYEGLDVNSALYEWNYPKQLLSIKLMERDKNCSIQLQDVFSQEYLLNRPQLEALQSEAQGKRVVLLIDELDRADEEFEAFLLELLSDFQVTIPEMGTVKTDTIPVVVITSNRTREIHDAVKRRCLYHWIDYPDLEKECRIVQARLPGINERLARQVCRFMQHLRADDLLKRPGVAETLDWAHALMALHRDYLDEETVRRTRGCLLKNRMDQQRFQAVVGNFF